MRRRLLVAVTVPATLFLIAGPAHAQEEELTLEAVQLNLDVVFLMLAAALVFFMQPGFAMLETGLTRSRDSANILMKNMADASFGILAYFFVGFGLMYGASRLGLIGSDTFALAPGSYTEGLGDDPFVAVDFFYQAVFAATAATIVSGAVAGRMRFSGYVILSVFMTALIYPVIGHWTWGGGWLDGLGYADFAGSGIVHLTGGIAGLTTAAILGPRLGKYGPGRKPRVMPGHSAPLAVLGTFILFFGWFGFNGGSVLEADGLAVAPVLLTTLLAGVAGGAAAICFTWARNGKPDVSMACNGVIAGLVGITAGADVVGPIAAVVVGLVAGVLVTLSVRIVDRLGVDDAVGAFSAHGTCGVLGVLWVGAFANTTDFTGFWHGGGWGLLGAQIVGALAIIAWVAAATAALALILKASGFLRVSEEVETEGLDIHEHGMYGYPELALGASAYPGAPGHLDGATVKPEAVRSEDRGSSAEDKPKVL
ncbi:MAG: ammonium transporter [Nitriliruptorales bacterium]|nr:ammonium transporter [Nitriliruptorales bacterium]